MWGNIQSAVTFFNRTGRYLLAAAKNLKHLTKLPANSLHSPCLQAPFSQPETFILQTQ